MNTLHKFAISVRVEVTEHHIKTGERFSLEKDPIALAILEHQLFDRVLVNRHNILLLKNNLRRTFDLPRNIKLQQARFDAGLAVKPYAFKLTI